jgi:hypothetical protein
MARQWQVSEITLTAERTCAQPFLDVEVTAEFSGPGGTLRLAAFWDGGDTWRVRFTPPTPGRWTYTITSTPDDAGLRAAGTLEVAPAAGDTPLQRHGGFLRVAGNARCLTYADGTPFFWLGDTWWFCPSDLVPFDTTYRTLVDTRARQGYTVAHMAFLGRLTPAGAHSGVFGEWSELLDGTVNPAYWQQVDAYMRYANDAGIMPVIGFGFHQGLNAPTPEGLRRLWRYVLARYGAFAVGWLLCGEYNQAGGPDGQLTEADTARIDKLLALGQFIKEHDPFRRALTVHPWWYGGEGRQAWPAPWYDYVLLQGGHGQDGPPPATYADARATGKPFLEGEVTYEGIFGFSAAVVRRNAYKAMQCGSLGFTYGAHGLWYPTQSADDMKFADWGTPVPWWEALQAPGGAQMAHLRAIYASLPWWTLTPVAADTVLTGAPDALASTDGRGLTVVYLPAAVPLTPAAPATLTLANPRTGAITDLGPVSGTLALPDAEDWVVVIRTQEL